MRREWLRYLPAACLVGLYVFRVKADGIGGIFGIFWDDEGGYLLAAKNQVLFGTAHFFAGDQWRPELLAPLLHYAGLLFITKNESVLYIRLFIAVCILCGAALIALLSGKRGADRKHATAAFIVVLLNPILFFYARIGLSEGIQFLVLTIIVAMQFGLYHAGSRASALGYATACGVAIAAFAIAKISAVPPSIGLVLGTLLCLWRNPRLTDKGVAVECFLLAGMATVALYFLPIIFSGQLNDWWRCNFGYIAENTPFDPSSAVEAFRFRLLNVAYYFALMPIFALYYVLLAVAADKRKGFVGVLAVSTVTIIVIESFFEGGLRRSFFGTSMLSIVSGFVFLDFLKDGVARTAPLPRARLAAFAVAVMQALGIVVLLYASLLIGDTLYIAVGLAFLSAMAIGFAASGQRYAAVRKALSGVVAVCALLPMLYQAFLASNTREIANRTLESLVPEDAVIVGPIAPWTFLGTKRRIVLTNCMFDDQYGVDFANDIDHLPLGGERYLLINSIGRGCVPADMARYEVINRFAMLFPLNQGGMTEQGSHAWSYGRPFTLYKRRAP
jgi:hypothetical protein